MFFFFIIQLLCSSLFLLHSIPHVFHLLFCLLYYVLPLHPLHCTMDLPFRLCTTSHPTHMPHTPRDTLYLVYSACLSHVKSSTWSSYELFIFSSRYSRFFGFSGSYLENCFLLCQSKFFIFSGIYRQSLFCLLWILSSFLHVTSGGDHMTIQKAPHVLGLASTSSLFSNMTLGD
jgi:hypothetical protein